jgi:hypothetical protein
MRLTSLLERFNMCQSLLRSTRLGSFIYQVPILGQLRHETIINAAYTLVYLRGMWGWTPQWISSEITEENDDICCEQALRFAALLSKYPGVVSDHESIYRHLEDGIEQILRAV